VANYSSGLNSLSSASPLALQGVTEICHMALHAHAIGTAHVRLNSVSTERHFTQDAVIFSRPYHPTYCSLLSEIYNMAHCAHAVHAVQFRLKSVRN
jgi:hypothetical protein